MSHLHAFNASLRHCHKWCFMTRLVNEPSFDKLGPTHLGNKINESVSSSSRASDPRLKIDSMRLVAHSGSSSGPLKEHYRAESSEPSPRLART
jgi:hypothetical protein